MEQLVDVREYTLVPASHCSDIFKDVLSSLPEITDRSYLSAVERVKLRISNQADSVRFLEPDPEGRVRLATKFLGEFVVITVNQITQELVVEFEEETSS